MKIRNINLDEMEVLLIQMERANHKNLSFANSAHSLWVRFHNYEKNPPYVIYDEDDNIAAVCMITVLQREPYANLYEIFSVKDGWASKLYWGIMEILYTGRSASRQRVERLKMSCTPSSIGWHFKNGIIGWGTDPSGSIRVDIPIMRTQKEQLELRENWKDNLDKIIPPSKNAKKLREEINMFGPKKQPKVDEAIDTMGEYYLRSLLYG